MIKINTTINSLLSQIRTIYVAQGVQPCELAEAIFESDYKSIDMTKTDDSVTVTVTFSEEVEGVTTVVIMRYTYSFLGALSRIEQRVGKSKFKLQWDRGGYVSDLVDRFAFELNKINPTLDLDKILATLPDDFKKLLLPKLQLVA